jgi:hypothetical protein
MARLEHTYFLRYFGPLGRMPHSSLLILFLIQTGKRGKWNYTIHGKIVMPEHTHIHTFTLIQTDAMFIVSLVCEHKSAFIWNQYKNPSACFMKFLMNAIPALSDEMTGLSFVYAVGPHQRSLLRSESLLSRDHILLSQIWHFPFRRLLQLAGSRWRYSNLPPHGWEELIITYFLLIWHRPHIKRWVQLFYCCVYLLQWKCVYQTVA